MFQLHIKLTLTLTAQLSQEILLSSFRFYRQPDRENFLY